MSEESAPVYQRDIEEMSLVELAGRIIGAIALSVLAIVAIALGVFRVIMGEISMIQSLGYPLWALLGLTISCALILPLNHYAAENGGSGL